MAVRGSRSTRVVAICLLGAAALIPGAAAQDPSSPDPSPVAAADICAPFRAAGSPPAASVATDPYGCRLPAWDPVAAWSLKGTLDTANAYRWADPGGESTDPQGEIVAVGWVPVSLSKADARAIVKSKAFLTKGATAKAIKGGDYLLVQVETSETPAIIADRHLSFHIGTDRRNDPGNNTPSSVEDPVSPYQDIQDLYTVYLSAGTQEPGLFATDFAGKVGASGTPWYNGSTAFAARITSDPPGVQFLLPAKAVGDTFRPMSATTPAAGAARSGLIASIAGSDTLLPSTFDQGTVVPSGSDFAALGTRMGWFPRDGVANAMVGCLSADTVHRPLRLRSLMVNDQVVEEPAMLSQVPLIWSIWPTSTDGDLLAAWFAAADQDGDGVVVVPATLTSKEVADRQVQGTDAFVMLRGGNLFVGTAVGLSRYGFHDLERIELASTGDPHIDELLRASADSALGIMPPWHVSEAEGTTGGDPGCIPSDAADLLGSLLFPPR